MSIPSAAALRLFGRFSATINGETPTELRISSKKGSALLAYLALHPTHTVSREKLAALFWGDRPDRQARLSLRQCLLSLRKALAPTSLDLLVIDGDEIELRVDRLIVDALEFTVLCNSTEFDDLERASHLYRGEFLCDLNIDAEGFDSWVRQMRTRFESMAARILEVCADRWDAANRGPLAIDAAERLVMLDPLREDWQRRLLGIYARHQGCDVALTHAKNFIGLLERELDVTPEAATCALISQIERGGIASPSVVAFDAARNVDIIEDGTTARQVLEYKRETVNASGSSETTRIPHGRELKALLGSRIIRISSIVAALLLAFWVSVFWQHHLVLAKLDGSVLADKGVTSIVVLPFKPIADGAPAANAISDDLIDALSRIGIFRVISRRTSHQYGGSKRDVAAIGSELNARYVVDGITRIDNAGLHVNVELIDAESRLQLWSDHFETGRNEPLAVDAIVRGMGRALQVNIINIRSNRATMSAKPGVSELLVKGWAALLENGVEDKLAEAEAYFGEALRRDPNSIQAMLGLAEHHILAVNQLAVLSQEPYLSDAERLIDRALRQQPEASQAYYSRSIVLSLRGQLPLALESIEHSLAINPSFAPGYAHMGRLLTRLGRIDEALDRIQYAIRLSPKDPALSSWTMLAGWAELERGHDAEALRWLFRSVALNPNNPLAQGSFAAVYALDGDRIKAEICVAKFRALTPAVTDERRLERFGAFARDSSPHRLADGMRLALGQSQ